MQRRQYKAVLLQAIQEASDLQQRGDLMTELIWALSVMITASSLHYRGGEGMLLEGITAVCEDIRAATADAYVEIQQQRAAHGQKA